MNCKEFKKRLPDYIDNKLPNNLADEFKNHLDSCTTCASLYQKLVHTLDLLKPTNKMEQQAFYFTRLKQKMENKNIAQPSFITRILGSKVVQPAIYLSSLILAVYIGILIGSGSVKQNQYAEFNDKDTSYIQTYAEYQYLNDIEIEPIENFLLSSNDIEK